MNEKISLIERTLKEFDLEISDYKSVSESLFFYYQILMKWNSKIALTKKNADFDFFLYQLKDTLSGFIFLKNEIEDGFDICDVGCGNGFLSIPLALVFDKNNIHCIEKNHKKIAFLNSTSLNLNLNNLKIIHSKVEDIKNTQFKIITMKAFLPLNTKTFSLLKNIFQENYSLILCYAGYQDNIPLNKDIYKLYKIKKNRNILKIDSLQNILNKS